MVISTFVILNMNTVTKNIPGKKKFIYDSRVIM